MKLLILSFILTFSAFASEAPVEAQYSKRGEGKLIYPLMGLFDIDVYRITLYVKQKQVNSQMVVKGAAPSFMRIEFLRDVPRDALQEGWKVGLKKEAKDPKYSAAVMWLIENTREGQKGKVLKISVDKNSTNLYYENQLFASSDDPAVRELVFKPWIGPTSVDKKLKEQLLSLR